MKKEIRRMRKLFILLKAFYQKIQLPAFFLFFIILIAEFLLVYLLGTYRFFTLTDRLFETVMRENALYVMRFTLSGFDGELFSELRAMARRKQNLRQPNALGQRRNVRERENTTSC